MILALVFLVGLVLLVPAIVQFMANGKPKPGRSLKRISGYTGEEKDENWGSM